MNIFLSAVTALFTVTLVGCFDSPLLGEPGDTDYHLDPVNELIAAPDGSIPKDSAENHKGNKVPVITIPFMVNDYFIPEGWLSPQFESGEYDFDKPQFEMDLSKICESTSKYTVDEFQCRSISYISDSDTNYVGMYWLHKANWGAYWEDPSAEFKTERAVDLKIDSSATKITFWIRGETNVEDLDRCKSDSALVANGSCGWLDSIKLVVGKESSTVRTSDVVDANGTYWGYFAKSAWEADAKIALDSKWKKYELRLNKLDDNENMSCSEFLLPLECDRHMYGWEDDSESQILYNAFGWLTATGPNMPIVTGYEFSFSIDSLMYSNEPMSNPDNFINEITGEE